MTTELEEQFYKVFGIQQEYQYHVRDMGRSYVGNKQMLIDNKHLFMDKERKRSRRLYVANVSKIYPEITDRILLELICIAYSAHDIDLTIEEIKENILQNLIESKDEVKHQIRQLFKEEE